MICKTINMIFRSKVMPVSYTHLDVYKRQAKRPSHYINGFMPSHCSQKIPVSHCCYDGCRKTMLSDKHFKSSRESQRFEKDRRPKC